MTGITGGRNGVGKIGRGGICLVVSAQLLVVLPRALAVCWVVCWKGLVGIRLVGRIASLSVSGYFIACRGPRST